MMTRAPRPKTHRVVTFLDREQVDLLDCMGKDALFSTGVKFPRTKIIAGLIDMLRCANVSGEGIRTERDFEQRLRAGFRAALLAAPQEAPRHEAAA